MPHRANVLPGCRRVFLSLMQWGDKYLQERSPPLTLVDAATQRRVGVRITDDLDGPMTGPDDIEVRWNA